MHLLQMLAACVRKPPSLVRAMCSCAHHALYMAQLGIPGSFSVGDMEQLSYVAYSPSPHWVADVILKVNACVGAFEELQDDDDSRRNQLMFGRLLAEIAGTSIDLKGGLEMERVRCVVFTASKIRRGIAKQLRAAQAFDLDDRALHFPMAAYDLLAAASRDVPVAHTFAEIQPSRREVVAGMSKHVPETLLKACSELLAQSENTMTLLGEGLAKLRSMLSDASLVYADTEMNVESDRIMDIICSRQTLTLVRNALNARAVACMFDSVRVAAGVMAASHALGVDYASVIPDVSRAAIGRADAYAVQRLYRTLEFLVAAMMMGQAQRASRCGNRDAWSGTDTGQAVLRIRHEIGDVLKAYDDEKRAAATNSNRAYCAQTPGYVSLLQEQAASIMLKTQELDSHVHRAIVDALSLPHLFKVGYGEKGTRYSYWEAIDAVQVWREDVFSETNDRRVAPIINCIAMVSGSAALASTDSELALPVTLTTAAYEAMRIASKDWPPMSNFHGKEYALTERKVMAKAAKQMRDPREVGESLGYRTEWVGFLSGAREGKRQTDKGAHADIRFGGAVTTLSHAEMLSRDLKGRAYASALPAPYGAALHNIHGIALSMEPSLLRAAADAGNPERSHLFEHADAHYNELMHALDEQMNEPGIDDAMYQSIVLERRGLVQDRVEKIATAFKSWSGGSVVTDLFHAFFFEVWRRFNVNLRADTSPWHDTVETWVLHYQAGTEPRRSEGASKLMHPWRFQHLQRGVARSLLEEWFGEGQIQMVNSPEARSALRIQRCMLSSVIELFDYGPWASYVMRRFCSIDERRYSTTGKRTRED